MEKLRYEVYLEGKSGDTTRMDVYSHIKQEWIFNDQVKLNEVFLILEQRTIKQDGTLIHLPDSHELFNAFTATKWKTKYFNGMSGKYQLTDGSIYDVFYVIPARQPKKDRQLTGSCIKSVTKNNDHIPLSEENVARNVRHKAWTKIS